MIATNSPIKISVPNVASGSQNRWRTMLIITIVVITLSFSIAEVIARFLIYLDPPPQSNNQLFDEKYYALQGFVNDGRPTIFCMGDSMMNRAIYPDLLKSLLDKKGLPVNVLNLAVDGSSPVIASKLIEVAARRKIIPSLILYDLKVDCLTTSATTTPVKARKNIIGQAESNADEIKTLNDSYLGKYVMQHPSFSWKGLEGLLERQLFIVRYRGDLKNKFRKFMQDACNNRLFEAKLCKVGTDYIPQSSRLGWNPNHSISNREKMDALADSMDKSYLHKTQNEQRNKETFIDMSYYDNLASYCRENHIGFGLLWLPHYAGFFNKHLFPYPINDEAVGEKIENLAKQENGLLTAVMRDGDDDPAYFTDPWHINTYGAVKTTEKLADMLSHAPYLQYLKKAN